jgi:integrase
MIYKRGKQGTYWIRFRFAGRFIHESARTVSKTVAREAERQRRRELELQWNRIERRTLPPLFEKAAVSWMASREQLVAPNTRSIAKLALKHLLPRFGNRLLCDISVEDIQHYQQARLSEKAEGRTINIELGTLRQVLKTNNCWQPLGNKVRMLRERKDVARALAAEEESRLLGAAYNLDSACYTAIVLALNTAMRKDEIRKLRWQQVDFERRYLMVGHSKTEAGSGRLIPLNGAAFDVLVGWARQFPNTEAEHYVFPFCENRHINPTRPTQGWRTAWRHALRKAGFHCRFHDLRVTAITKLAESESSDLVIMSIAGHVSRRMLEHYSRIRMDAKRRALECIDQVQRAAVFGAGVHQNVNQLAGERKALLPKVLN